MTPTGRSLMPLRPIVAALAREAERLELARDVSPEPCAAHYWRVVVDLLREAAERLGHAERAAARATQMEADHEADSGDLPAPHDLVPRGQQPLPEHVRRKIREDAERTRSPLRAVVRVERKDD